MKGTQVGSKIEIEQKLLLTCVEGIFSNSSKFHLKGIIPKTQDMRSGTKF